MNRDEFNPHATGPDPARPGAAHASDDVWSEEAVPPALRHALADLGPSDNAVADSPAMSRVDAAVLAAAAGRFAPVEPSGTLRHDPSPRDTPWAIRQRGGLGVWARAAAVLFIAGAAGFILGRAFPGRVDREPPIVALGPAGGTDLSTGGLPRAGERRTTPQMLNESVGDPASRTTSAANEAAKIGTGAADTLAGTIQAPRQAESLLANVQNNNNESTNRTVVSTLPDGNPGNPSDAGFAGPRPTGSQLAAAPGGGGGGAATRDGTDLSTRGVSGPETGSGKPPAEPDTTSVKLTAIPPGAAHPSSIPPSADLQRQGAPTPAPPGVEQSPSQSRQQVAQQALQQNLIAQDSYGQTSRSLFIGTADQTPGDRGGARDAGSAGAGEGGPAGIRGLPTDTNRDAVNPPPESNVASRVNRLFARSRGGSDSNLANRAPVGSPPTATSDRPATSTSSHPSAPPGLPPVVSHAAPEIAAAATADATLRAPDMATVLALHRELRNAAPGDLPIDPATGERLSPEYLLALSQVATAGVAFDLTVTANRPTPGLATPETAAAQTLTPSSSTASPPPMSPTLPFGAPPSDSGNVRKERTRLEEQPAPAPPPPAPPPPAAPPPAALGPAPTPRPSAAASDASGAKAAPAVARPGRPDAEQRDRRTPADLAAKPAPAATVFDVIVDAGPNRLAAWQVEIALPDGPSQIVSILPGPLGPWTSPPFADTINLPARSSNLGRYTLDPAPPSGPQGVARIVLSAPPAAVPQLRLVTAATPDGKRFIAPVLLRAVESTGAQSPAGPIPSPSAGPAAAPKPTPEPGKQPPPTGGG